MVPPLALDIDGTLTTEAEHVDPRVFEVLPAWDAPVVFATGKAFPYPVALAHFLGLPERVIAENGGVVLVDDEVTYAGDPERIREAVAAFEARGGSLGWGNADLVNRWRETEVAISLDADAALLRAVVEEYGLDLVDSGYAYHVKSPGVQKGEGLRTAAAALGLDPGAFVAVGDSETDASTFAVAGRSFAVGNADDAARAAADTVLDADRMDGTLAALDAVR
ncbi:MAG: HAD-IIB family hydrolase [Haloferacaceae archaeon]